MDVEDRLAGRFEASRPRLRAMAYRMLGSLSDADDAVQEGWLHVARATARGGADDVANLGPSDASGVILTFGRSAVVAPGGDGELLAPLAQVDGPATR